MVLTGECAKALTRYYKAEDNPIPYLSSNDFKTVLIQNVPLPDEKTCDWCVDFCYLPEVETIASIEKENGQEKVPMQELLSARVLCHMNVRYKAHHMTLVGGLELEGNDTSTKLICSRMQRILCKDISDLDTKTMFSNNTPFCGKHDMEVQRVSGTNGRVNDQSTRDILSLLAKDDKLLPSKAGACLILPGEKYYWIFYKCHEKKSGKSPIVMYKYSPPQTGGSVRLHPNALDVFPVIGEFEYVKMISVLLLNEMNRRETFLKGKPISEAALASELASISNFLI
jgi:hypothetical protein